MIKISKLNREATGGNNHISVKQPQTEDLKSFWHRSLIKKQEKPLASSLRVIYWEINQVTSKRKMDFSDKTSKKSLKQLK